MQLLKQYVVSWMQTNLEFDVMADYKFLWERIQILLKYSLQASNKVPEKAIVKYSKSDGTTDDEVQKEVVNFILLCCSDSSWVSGRYSPGFT